MLLMQVDNLCFSSTLDEMIVVWMLRMFVCGEDQPLNHLGAGYISLCVTHVCYSVNEAQLLELRDKHHLVISMFKEMFSVLFMLSRTKAN